MARWIGVVVTICSQVLCAKALPLPSFELLETRTFDGSGAGLETIQDPGACSSGNVARTVMFWFKRDWSSFGDVQVYPFCMAGPNTQNAKDAFCIRIYGSFGAGNLHGGVWGGWADWDTNIQEQIRNDEWQHIAVTYTGSEFTLFMDGVQVSTGTFHYGPYNVDCSQTSIHTAFFGHWENDPRWVGDIRELRVWNSVALSAAEVQTMAATMEALPLPSFELLETRTFDGSGAGLETIQDPGACSSGNVARTVMFWFKRDWSSFGDVQVYPFCMAGPNTQGAKDAFCIRIYGSFGAGNLHGGVWGGWADWDTNIQEQIRNDEWQHIAVTYTGSEFTLFMDGVQVSTGTFHYGPYNVDCSQTSIHTAFFGHWEDDPRWVGDIRELRVWNSVALSAAEVQTMAATMEAWGCTTGSGSGCKTCVEQSSRTSDTTCATCNNGYYESTGSCQAWGCTTGSGTGCKTCVEQSSRTSDTTCATCNNGYYESTGSCQANQCSCLNGDAVADGIDCTNDGDNICVGCDAGYFLQSAECQACGSDCQTCSDSTTCTTCENDKFLHNGNCITSCPAGYASLGSNPGKFCQAYGCTIGPDEGCADCVSQELRINDASCSSCNDETYGYYVDVNDFTCNSICIDQVCTCPVGMHGSTTLVGDASFGGCHISPTSIDAWVIKLSDEDDAVVYDEISKKIIVMFEKSGGRTHQLSLFKVDCTTEVPDNDLLKLVSANGQLAGVNIDDLENEFLHMEIDVDLTKMESTSLRDTTAATGKVDFCVRADLKDGPGANSHGVNFIRARMTMEVNIVASIQEVAVKLESTDTDISMGPDDALTHVIELDACQCGIDALEPNDRCVESEAAHRDVSIDSPPKLTPSDRLILCISTQTDVVEIHEINNLKLTQPSDSGGDSTTFDVIEDSIVSGLASYDSLDKQTGHIHRVRTNLVNTFFKNTGSGTIDQTDVTVSGTAKVLFKPSRRLALANVVIKRSLQEQQEREGRFSMTIALQGNEDVEAPASTVALTGTTEALATAVAPTTTAEASIALTSSTTTTTLLWGYEVKSNMKCKNKGGEIELIIPDGTENLEHFCASKCNITGSCVGFVSKDKEAICGLRLRSMFAPTQNHGTSCYVRTGQASVQVTMRVENIEHSFLMANEGLLSQFVERVQRVVAQNAGNGVSHEDVEVLLSPGSIVIEASVHAYSGLEPAALHQELTTSVNILDDLAQSLQSIPGIASVSTGAIAVSNFQAAHRSATTPSDQTPKSKDSDKFDWVLFVLIPGATLMFVLCLLCCAIWALRVRKQHRKEDDRQTVSGNDEESQKQEPSKAMTPSPASATAQTPIAASTALAETDAVIFVVDSNDQAQLKDVVSI